MATKKKDYFDLSWLVSVILAIIPITSVVCGIITRFLEKPVAGIVRLIIAITGIGSLILWVVDLVCMITKQKIWRLL